MHTVKKAFRYPVPSREVTYGLTTLSLGGTNDVIYKLFPPRENLVSDIPAGDGIHGNIEKLFFRCRKISFLPPSVCYSMEAMKEVCKKKKSRACMEDEYRNMHCKKRFATFPSQAGMSLIKTLPGRE